jgi:hypothetical protein
MSAGKRQRNLSQEHLGQIRIPALEMDEQHRIAANYAEGIAEISTVLTAGPSLMGLADEVIVKTSIEVRPFRLSRMSCDRVSLAACAESPVLRVDTRYHRQEVRAVLAVLDSVETVSLGSLLTAPALKGRQPTLLSVDDPFIETRVVATASIQGGQVVRELTKPTDEDEIAEAGERKLRAGDLLVTMDGEGSIGKAAVFDGAYAAVPDSHVAILRPHIPELALAIACYLNSSLGQAQIELMTSGATGQTQLAADDLARLLVPLSVVTRASQVGEDFEKRLVQYETGPTRVRRIICERSTFTSMVLAASSAFTGQGALALAECDEADALLRYLELLRPDMF